jgi:hypothetical protein
MAVDKRPTPDVVWKAGDRLPAIADLDFSKAERTLLLFLSSRCTFCTRSMPFYGKLVSTRQESGASVRFVALSTEPRASLLAYTQAHGVVLDQIISIDRGQLPPLKMRGTPTLVLVDDVGSVLQHWRGMLPPSGEAEVEMLVVGAENAGKSGNKKIGSEVR